ncbi:MAG TPA: zf-HC2 domain-containing protein [Pyrinomonadaceae bacterium]
MRCLECQPELEAYFDGELGEGTTEQVAEHLSACASCANVYRKLEAEQGLYLRYECDAQPAPDFWDNVMARTAEVSTARNARPHFSRLRDFLGGTLGQFNALRFSPSATALFVIVAIAVTIGVMRFVNQRKGAAPPSVAQNEGVPATTPTEPSPEVVRTKSSPEDDSSGGVKPDAPDASEQPLHVKNRAGRKDKTPSLTASNDRSVRAGFKSSATRHNPTSDELVREAEQKYVAAIAVLSRDVNRRRSQIDPETARRFAQTLSAVDRTIADTRRAARKHPNDPVAAQYMLTAYAKKVDVLRELIGY